MCNVPGLDGDQVVPDAFLVGGGGLLSGEQTSGSEGSTPSRVRKRARMTPVPNYSLSGPIFDSPEAAESPIAEEPVVPEEEPFVLEPENQFGPLPFDLGVAHHLPAEHLWRVFYECVALIDYEVLNRKWVIHRTPWDLEIDGVMLKNQLIGGGEMGYLCMDGAVRMYNGKELRMMALLEDIVVRHLAFGNLSVQLLVPAEDYDMEFILRMFNSEMLGYSVGRCRLIMTPISIDDAWCLYAFDMERQVVNVLDSIFTDRTMADYAEKHACFAHELQGIAAIGRELEDGWAINVVDWEVAYNIGRELEQRSQPLLSL